MVEPLPLVRDVLDKQIYDVNKIKVGKVDGLILSLRQGRPPRVHAIEISMSVAFQRVSRHLGGWLERLQHWLAPDLVGPTRILFDHVVRTGIDVEVDIDARRTNAFVWESWIREKVFARIPGGKASGEKG